MALAVLLAQKNQIVALIVDHGLRPEAADEAARASQILTSLGIENHTLKISKKLLGNAQEQARIERYKLLTNWCKKNGYSTLATAHHADDNAENFLLRLSRGSGVDGLASIASEIEMHNVKIIRPLLKFSKAELQNFLLEQKISWVEDASNTTDKYARNRLRHALEQLEEKELISKRINETADNMARVRDYLEQQTQLAEANCVDYEKQKIHLANFVQLHEEIAYRLLLNVIARIAKPAKRPRFEKLKNLYQAILAGKKMTLAGLIFSTKANQVVIELEKK